MKAKFESEDGNMDIKSKKDDLQLKGLGQFIGTTQYWKGWLDTNYTEGIKYISENGYSWFVTDAISIIKVKFMQEPFIVIMLKLLDDNKAQMIIDDGNGNVLYTQDYEYTDAKRELTLYFIDNVLMLSGEY